MRTPDLSLNETKPLFEGIRKIEGNHVPKNIIITLIVFLVCNVAFVIIQWLFVSGLMMLLHAAGISASGGNAELLIALYSTIVMILLTFFFTGVAEKRPAYTMLVRRQKCLHDYLRGAILGFVMMGAVVLMAWAGGALQFDGTTEAPPFLMAALFGGWMIQGFSEEILCRGYLMMSAGTYTHPWVGVGVSAVFFAVMHLGNDGISVFALVNLILYGVVMAILMLRTGSIWSASALHTVWNWAQGNFFGMQVSGIETDATVLKFSQTGAAEWLGGARFGLEAGAGTTVVLVIMLIAVLVMPQRKPHI